MNAVVRQPVVLLGASNLTIGWPDVTRALQSGLSAPVDLFVALGMGRSYVDWSRYFARRLPGIMRCGLWNSLHEAHASPSHSPASPAAADRSALPPLVLLTDIGNDLVYGRTPEQIAESVEDCMMRLRSWNADCRILATELPLYSLNSMSRFRFVVARRLLFPKSLIQFPDVLSDAERLNQLIHDAASRHQVQMIRPLDHWYGMDPIHIRRPLRYDAFRHLFSHWEGYQASDSILTVSEKPPLPSAAARIVFGKPRLSSQPVFQGCRLRVSGF